jgi:hypothetical protein
MLAPAQSCTLTIAFTPSGEGQRSATLTVDNDGAQGSLAISLQGEGTPIPAPRVSFESAAGTLAKLEFGEQTVGGLYASREVRVRNTGTATLAITNAAVDSAAFAVVGPSSCAAVEPQQACTLQLRFTAAATGAAVGNLRLTTNAAPGVQLLRLEGTGVPYVVPQLAWEQVPANATVGFGLTAAGTASALQSLMLRNAGPGGVVIAKVQPTGADAGVFGVDVPPADASACRPGMTLLAMASCRVDLRFLPATSGERRAGLQVFSTGNPPAAIGLLGTGLADGQAAVALSASALDFGAVRVGAQSQPREIVLSSHGSVALRLLSVTVTGPFAVSSSTCGTLPVTLAPGTTCSVLLQALPGTTGSAQGELVAQVEGVGVRRVALSAQGEPAPDVTAALSGGGCTMIDGEAPHRDATLWLLLAAAAGVLCWRAATARRAGRRPRVTR